MHPMDLLIIRVLPGEVRDRQRLCAAYSECSMEARRRRDKRYSDFDRLVLGQTVSALVARHSRTEPDVVKGGLVSG